jgi:hypothetical protein
VDLGLLPLKRSRPIQPPPDIETSPPVVMIFVHSFGDTPRGTWKHKESTKSWPEWLLEDKRLAKLANFHIYTFGYISKISNHRQLGIPDFARQLNNDLEFLFKDDKLDRVSIRGGAMLIHSRHPQSLLPTVWVG